MAITKTETVSFSECCCATCGMYYFVPSNWQRQKRESHQTFYCPAGHSQCYPHETDAEKLRRELDMEKRRHEFTKNEVKAERAARESAERKLTRIGKRVANGVCPHCNRHFTNLERHIHTKHVRDGEGGGDGE